MMNESLNNDVLKTFNALTKLTNAINFAGGEVFLDIDKLHEMVQLGLKKSIQMSIISNGYQLLKHLDDPKIHFILKHIDKLGISLDSFNETTNGSIGRKTLDLKSLIKVSNLCRQYRTKLKINTVVSKLNHYEHMVDAIEQISPDVWKIIEVYSDVKGGCKM
jgi:radical S-adenosyl methionine domain-containing protein 2